MKNVDYQNKTDKTGICSKSNAKPSSLELKSLSEALKIEEQNITVKLFIDKQDIGIGYFPVLILVGDSITKEVFSLESRLPKEDNEQKMLSEMIRMIINANKDESK